MTSDLVSFLLARIDEDEAVARAASPGGWLYGTVGSVAGGTLYDKDRRIADLVYVEPEKTTRPSARNGHIVRHLPAHEADSNGTHIARHDPARVIAECQAKRSALAEAGCREDLVAACLAVPYADHPDYREEWRP